MGFVRHEAAADGRSTSRAQRLTIASRPSLADTIRQRVEKDLAPPGNRFGGVAADDGASQPKGRGGSR